MRILIRICSNIWVSALTLIRSRFRIVASCIISWLWSLRNLLQLSHSPDVESSTKHIILQLLNSEFWTIHILKRDEQVFPLHISLHLTSHDISLKIYVQKLSICLQCQVILFIWQMWLLCFHQIVALMHRVTIHAWLILNVAGCMLMALGLVLRFSHNGYKKLWL